MLPLWQDAIETWDTRGHPELERRKRLLFEWLIWMTEANVLVPPFTDLPIKFERDSAPPVDIEAYTTEMIEKAVEAKLRAQAGQTWAKKSRLLGGDTDDTQLGIEEGDEKGVVFDSEYASTSTSTLRPEEPQGHSKDQDQGRCDNTGDSLSDKGIDVTSLLEPIEAQVEVCELWTFTSEETNEL